MNPEQILNEEVIYVQIYSHIYEDLTNEAQCMQISCILPPNTEEEYGSSNFLCGTYNLPEFAFVRLNTLNNWTFTLQIHSHWFFKFYTWYGFGTYKSNFWTC